MLLREIISFLKLISVINPADLMFKNVPKSLAIIPDGNRRWALSHRFSVANGYSIGVRKFIDFAEWCKDYGIKNITVWAFSTENFNRPFLEKKALFGIYLKAAKDKSIINRLHENRTKLNIVGNLSLLPGKLRKALRDVSDQTAHYRDRELNMLIAYGGRDDIMHAAKTMAAHAAETNSYSISESAFKNSLFSCAIPDLDLIIRTSGEERLSGLMPWQSVYSELYFSKKLWPDFTKRDLSLALSEYSYRHRRFGR
jgi:undecaprenyl diphosphate synthase